VGNTLIYISIFETEMLTNATTENKSFKSYNWFPSPISVLYKPRCESVSVVAETWMQSM